MGSVGSEQLAVGMPETESGEGVDVFSSERTRYDVMFGEDVGDLSVEEEGGKKVAFPMLHRWSARLFVNV